MYVIIRSTLGGFDMDDINRYLNDLYKFKRYFSATDEVFRTVSSVSIDTFGLMNEQSYMITPFFREIVDYSLINYYIEEEEFEELRYLSKKHSMFDEAEEVYTLCTEFSDFLIRSECSHPSILTLKDLVGTETTYDNMMDNIADIILDDTINIKKVVDLFSDVDNDVINYFDDMMETLKQNISQINSVNVLISVLKNCCRYRALKKGSVEGNNYYYDDNWCRFSNNNKTSISLSYLISSIERLFPFDSWTQSLINDTKTQYQLYKKYQYSYLKDKYKEDKLFEKGVN